MAKGELALENRLRKMIFNHITTYPGVSFKILKNVFDLSDGALRYHLDYLEKNEKISTGVQRGIRCYYPHYNLVNVPRKSSDDLRLHKLTPDQERILDIIKHYPGINQKELKFRSRLNRFQVAPSSREYSSIIPSNPVSHHTNISTLKNGFSASEKSNWCISQALAELG